MGKVLFSQVSVCPHFREGGTPILPDWGKGVPSSQVRRGGTPMQGLYGGRGYSPHPSQDGEGRQPGQDGGGTPNQNRTACTCCVAGGMPLTFMQEDFLVICQGLFKLVMA